MAYRKTSKRKKIWSEQANAKQDRIRQENAAPYQPDISRKMTITVEREGTGEKAVFECTEGNRIDNYRVHCNGKYQGIQSITTITKNIRKALPAFRQMN